MFGEVWRILLVDDDQKYRRMLREYLEKLGHQVLETGEGDSAIALAETAHPQVILLDFDLPDARGSSICRLLKAEPSTSSIPVAMVTAHGEEDARVEGFEAGADDYVVKPFSFRELLLRIRVLIEGGPRRAASVVSCGALTIDFDTRRASVNGVVVELSPPEFALLRSLCAPPSRVWTRDELLQSIWGRDAEVADRVVDGLVCRLREKLGGAGYCIQTVRGVGYRLDARTS